MLITVLFTAQDSVPLGKDSEIWWRYMNVRVTCQYEEWVSALNHYLYKSNRNYFVEENKDDISSISFNLRGVKQSFWCFSLLSYFTSATAINTLRCFIDLCDAKFYFKQQVRYRCTLPPKALLPTSYYRSLSLRNLNSQTTHRANM